MTFLFYGLLLLQKHDSFWKTRMLVFFHSSSSACKHQTSILWIILCRKLWFLKFTIWVTDLNFKKNVQWIWLGIREEFPTIYFLFFFFSFKGGKIIFWLWFQSMFTGPCCFGWWGRTSQWRMPSKGTFLTSQCRMPGKGTFLTSWWPRNREQGKGWGPNILFKYIFHVLVPNNFWNSPKHISAAVYYAFMWSVCSSKQPSTPTDTEDGLCPAVSTIQSVKIITLIHLINMQMFLCR